MKFIIYGKEGCSFCQKAKRLLEVKGLPFTYIDFVKQGMSKEELAQAVGLPSVSTVPQILEQDTKTYIGGFNELVTYLDKGV